MLGVRAVLPNTLDAVRAHLLEMTGDSQAAAKFYPAAAAKTVNLPERNYLLMQAARLSTMTGDSDSRCGIECVKEDIDETGMVKRFGWFHLPVSVPGALVSCAAVVFCINVF